MPVADRGPQISLVRESRWSTQPPDRGFYGCRQKESDCINTGVVTFQHPNAHSNPHNIAVSPRTPIFAPRGFLHRGLSNACPIVPARVVVPAVEGRHRTTLNEEQPLTKADVRFHLRLCENSSTDFSIARRATCFVFLSEISRLRQLSCAVFMRLASSFYRSARFHTASPLCGHYKVSARECLYCQL